MRSTDYNQGHLEQFGTPSDIYDRPASSFVNTFVGAANILKGKIITTDAGAAEVELTSGGTLTGRTMQEGLAAGDAVAVCLRPEQLRRSDAGLADSIEMSLPLGASIIYEVRLANGSSLKISEQRNAGCEPATVGQSVFIAPSNLHSYRRA